MMSDLCKKTSILSLIVLLFVCNTIDVTYATTSCSLDLSNDLGLSPYLHTTTSLANSQLSLVVAVPQNYQNVIFNFVGGDDTNCAGNIGWTESTSSDSADDCMVLKTNTITLANLNTYCNPQRTTLSTFVNLKFSVRVSAVQSVSASNGGEDQVVSLDRPVINSLNFILRFPRFVQAEANATQVTNLMDGDKVPGQIALITTDVNATGTLLDTTLDVEFMTVVTYPDLVNQPSIRSLPTGVNATFITASRSTDCPAESGAICKQFWRIRAYIPTASRCDFTGVYTIQFPFKCQDSYKGTCVMTGLLGTFNIRTFNHCPKITTAQIDATLATFSDSKYNDAATVFRTRTIVYGQMDVTSDTATIASVKLMDLTMKQTGKDDIVMLNGGAITYYGSNATCQFRASTDLTVDSRANFQCRLQPFQIVLPSKGSRLVIWTARAEVVYKNTGGDGTSRLVRRLLSFSSEQHPEHQDFAEAATRNTIVAEDYNPDEKTGEEDEEESQIPLQTAVAANNNNNNNNNHEEEGRDYITNSIDDVDVEYLNSATSSSSSLMMIMVMMISTVFVIFF